MMMVAAATAGTDGDDGGDDENREERILGRGARIIDGRWGIDQLRDPGEGCSFFTYCFCYNVIW